MCSFNIQVKKLESSYFFRNFFLFKFLIGVKEINYIIGKDLLHALLKFLYDRNIQIVLGYNPIHPNQLLSQSYFLVQIISTRTNFLC